MSAEDLKSITETVLKEMLKLLKDAKQAGKTLDDVIAGFEWRLKHRG